MTTKQTPEQILKKDFPDLAEAMAAHCITTTVPDEPNGQPLELWVMPIGQVLSWMKIANKQAIATATQQAVEPMIPWSGSEYAGWMPLEYNFKNESDAKKWIEQKYLETKKDPDLIGKCKWTDNDKTKFKAKVETRFETECGMEYDETTIYYEIKPMEFEALSQK